MAQAVSHPEMRTMTRRTLMVEVDYPHAYTSWPGSPGVIGEQLSSLSAEQRYEVLQGNARRVFDFEPVL